MTTFVIAGLSLVVIAKSTSGLLRVLLLVGFCVGFAVVQIQSPISQPQMPHNENCP